MTLPPTPLRIRECFIGDATLLLRRPDRSELSEIVEFVDGIRASGESSFSEGFLEAPDDRLAALVVRSCVREGDSPEAVLTEEEALEWAYEAQVEEQTASVTQSVLVATCLRLCGMGAFVRGNGSRSR